MAMSKDEAVTRLIATVRRYMDRIPWFVQQFIEAAIKDVEEAGKAEEKKPRRRVVIDLKLHADSWSAAIDELDEIKLRLGMARDYGSHPIILTSGGYNTGYTLNADEDATITHASYMAAITEALKDSNPTVKTAEVGHFEIASVESKPSDSN